MESYVGKRLDGRDDIREIIGVGGMAVTLLFSQFAFKEKLRIAQWFGILAGTAATVLLSL